MVHGDQQPVLILPQSDQPASNQRTLFKIKRPAGFLRNQSLEFTLGALVLAQIIFD